MKAYLLYYSYDPFSYPFSLRGVYSSPELAEAAGQPMVGRGDKAFKVVEIDMDQEL